MDELLRSLPAEARDALERKWPPRSPKPMLATLTDRRFSDAEWIYERKLDGERCVAVRDGDDVRLLSRNGRRLNDTYPELVGALSMQRRGSFCVDGEIVAFAGKRTSFSRLQVRMQIDDREEALATRVKVFYYLFDLLNFESFETTSVGLRQRKGLLRRGLDFADPIRFTPHRNEEGKAHYEQACRKKWEGIIAKRADSRYVHGRSKEWLKFKCVARQEFVIAGYSDPEGERIGFGALLIGYHDRGDLVYAGKVGTGFDDETLKRLSERLRMKKRKTPPFTGGELPRKDVHWVTPDLVAEIAFSEWTNDGKLRHPRFIGIRRDKDPEDVVREGVGNRS